MWYNDLVRSARFFGLPAVALAGQGAMLAMLARRAVLLTAQGSDPRLLPTILLESTLIGTLQVFMALLTSS